MADNTVLDAGVGGDTIATDDIGGVKHQRVKVQYGVDGAATDVSDSNPLPIDDAGGSLTVDNAGTFAVQAAQSGTWTLGANDGVDIGDVTINNASIAVTNSGTFAVQQDNLHSADFDTGAGTDTTVAIGIAVPASGGAAVVPGDATAGLKVDLGADNDVTVTGTVDLGATDNAVLDQIEVNTSYGDNTGNGTAAGSLRVTVASDSTGTIAATQSGTWILGANSGVDIGDVTINNASIAVTNGGTFAVQESGGALTALQLIDDTIFADDAAFTLASSKVSMAGAIRDDATSTLTAIEGDAVPLRVNASGALHVNVDSFTGSQVDDAAFTPGTGSVSMIGATFDDTTPDSVDEGDGGAVRMSARREMYVQLRDASGNEQGLDIVAEDTAHSTGDTGIMPLAVRNDNLAALSGTDGDYSPLQVNAEGALYATLPGYQSSGNTTTTPLGISATYTGTGEQNEYPDVMVSCFADQTGTLYFDFSVDGSNWRTFPTNGFAVAANTHEFHTALKGPRHFRVRFVNDATGQSTFQLYTYYGNFSKLPNAPLNQTIATDSDAIITNSVIAAFNGTNYANIESTAGGNLKISLQEASDGMDIGAGNAGTETLRVSIATDDVNLSGILADTASMDTNLGTVAGAVSAGQMQVDIVADGAGLLTTAAHDAAFGTAGSADTQVRTVQGIASMTPLLVDATGQGDVPITLSGEAVVLGAGSASIGTLGANSGVDIGDVDVTSIAAGANLIGDVGLSGARTSGGTTPYYNDGTASLTQIKGSGGQVYWLHVVNISANPVYLQMFNLLSASVTLGTTTPTNEFVIPTQGDSNGAGFTLSIPNGLAYGTGISFAITTTQGGATPISANNGFVNLGYA